MPPVFGQPLPNPLELPLLVGEKGSTSGANQPILQAEDRAGAEVRAVEGVSPDGFVHLCTRRAPGPRIPRVHRFPFAFLHLSSVHLCTWYYL